MMSESPASPQLMAQTHAKTSDINFAGQKNTLLSAKTVVWTSPMSCTGSAMVQLNLGDYM